MITVSEVLWKNDEWDEIEFLEPFDKCEEKKNADS